VNVNESTEVQVSHSFHRSFSAAARIGGASLALSTALTARCSLYWESPFQPNRIVFRSVPLRSVPGSPAAPSRSLPAAGGRSLPGAASSRGSVMHRATAVVGWNEQSPCFPSAIMQLVQLVLRKIIL